MTQFNVSLPDDDATRIKALGRGKLSAGILRLLDEHDGKDIAAQPTRTRTAKPAPDAEPERPADPRNPTGHKATQNRLDKEDREKEQHAKNVHEGRIDDIKWEFEKSGHWERMREAGAFVGWPEVYHHPEKTIFSPEEMVELQAGRDHYLECLKAIDERCARNTAETKRLRDAGLPDTRGAPVVQTLKLSLDAQRRLGLFGTPESMTDEQIIETNAAYSGPAPDDEEETWG